MSKKTEEEPDRAFPNSWYGHEGMLLRDYFAAKAMEGYVAHGNGSSSQMPKWAYEIADAMLAERDKQ